MRIVTWNINSINARKALAAEFLDKEAPDVLALQELKLETHKVPIEIFESRGYHVAAFGQKSWNGVLIASKQPLTDIETGLEGDHGEARYIAATSYGLRFINLYCPQGQAVESEKFPFKLGFFDGLIARLHARQADHARLVLLGDINIAPEPEDLHNPSLFENVPTFHPEERARFSALLASGLSDLVKPHLPPKSYSFWDYRNGDFRFNRGIRIDHILGGPEVVPLVKGAGVMRDWRKKREDITPSDHAPVYVDLTLDH